MLHETAVSWIRYRETKTRPKEPWNETVADFGSRLKAICQDINDTLEVDDLCRSLPKRLRDLKDREGDRLDH